MFPEVEQKVRTQFVNSLERRFAMKGITKTIALTAILVLTTAGFESLAQSANSTRQKQVRGQQEQIKKHSIQNQAQVAKNGQKKAQKGKKSGPADGSGNKGNRPKDGTGYGSNSGNRTGPQDGTGPQHRPGGRNNGGGGKGRRGGRN
jgi:hypothetical protein